MHGDGRPRTMRSNTALSFVTRQGRSNRLLAWAVSGAIAFMHGHNADKPPKLRFHVIGHKFIGCVATTGHQNIVREILV